MKRFCLCTHHTYKCLGGGFFFCPLFSFSCSVIFLPFSVTFSFSTSLMVFTTWHYGVLCMYAGKTISSVLVHASQTFFKGCYPRSDLIDSHLSLHYICESCCYCCCRCCGNAYHCSFQTEKHMGFFYLNVCTLYKLNDIYTFAFVYTKMAMVRFGFIVKSQEKSGA